MDAAIAAGARIVLAVTFVLAAVAKYARPGAVREQMRTVLWDDVAPLAAMVVPASELVLAAALLIAWRAAWPPWCALAVLGVFTVVLVRAQLRRVPCPCFGGASATPVGAAHVLRNGWLMALCVLAAGPASEASVAGAVPASAIFAAVTVACSAAAR
ncbi:MAG: hypothetical protein KatS3mg010_0240 [Acidimicrobiia bacterium]|nr:MAG: hypothetical protein KatS3mg010_0240 [Acidimicrobiia bacterium]